MDYYQFINSRDIREHLRKLNYQFSSIEAAWLVWQSRNHSLNEKHKAWQEIINTMPDCEIKKRPNTRANPSLHLFLKDLMALEDRCIESLKQQEPNSIFSCTYLLPTDVLWSSTTKCFFPNFSECFTSALLECKEYTEDDELRECFVRVRKNWLDRSESYIEVQFTSSGEVVKIIKHGKLTQAEDNLVFQGLVGLWLYFPTPFEVGDIICDTERQDEFELEGGPCVIQHTIPWEDGVSRWQKSGDYSDMVVHGLFQRMNGTIYEECTDSYMDFEYYRRPLTGKRRILGAISNYLKGEITLELLLAAYNTVLSEERTIETRPWNITKEGLDLAYIPEKSG